MKKLQIGDRIYVTNDLLGVIGVLTVVRLTQNFAITDRRVRFKINTDNGFCQETPRGDPLMSMGRCYYQLETSELIEIFQKQKLVSKLNKFDFKKLDLKTLIEITNKLT